eukprot:6214656-Pleurochrysis_carterae.AAC.4
MVLTTAVEAAISSKQQIVLFIDHAPGSAGKAYCFCIAELLPIERRECACASTGIAALLSDGGKILHARAHIPLDVKEERVFNIIRT